MDVLSTLKISNPEKIMWPETGTTKLDFISYVYKVSEYMLPYLKDRCLTVIRYPDGVEGESFYQKNVPSYAPSWIQRTRWKNTEYILCNNKETLLWLANLASLEFHIPFNRYDKENYPTELVFDLDPSVPGFDRVREAALVLRDTLNTYQDIRKLSHFISTFLVEKRPDLFTVERLKKNRGEKLYIDYVQQAPGKTLPAPYTVRARMIPTVSTPVTWEEVEWGFLPEDFTIENIPERLKEKGDLFFPLYEGEKESLDEVLEFIGGQWLN
jgi:bifunctional non-homologous end joining protein LigD